MAKNHAQSIPSLTQWLLNWASHTTCENTAHSNLTAGTQIQELSEKIKRCRSWLRNYRKINITNMKLDANASTVGLNPKSANTVASCTLSTDHSSVEHANFGHKSAITMRCVQTGTILVF